MEGSRIMCVKILGRDFHTRSVLVGLFGLAWIFMGIIALLEPSPDRYDIGGLLFYVPSVYRSIMWLLTGSTAILAALDIVNERFGWAALVLMSTERAVAFMYSFIMYLVPGVPQGMPEGIAECGFWTTITCVIIVMSKLTDRSLR
jgi:hypothetical protein